MPAIKEELMYYSRDYKLADQSLGDGTPGLLAANQMAFGHREPTNRKMRRLVARFKKLSRELNRLPWYAADKRSQVQHAMNRLVFRMAMTAQEKERRMAVPTDMEFCPSCWRMVTPVLMSWGGSNGDDWHDDYRCPKCKYRFDD